MVLTRFQIVVAENAMLKKEIASLKTKGITGEWIDNTKDVMKKLTTENKILTKGNEKLKRHYEELTVEFKAYREMFEESVNESRKHNDEIGESIEIITLKSDKIQKMNNDRIKTLKDEVKSLEKDIKTLLEEKYDGDDWAWCYGKKKNIDDDDDTEPNSVDFIMCGGCDMWWNYVIDENEKVYIRSKDGLNHQKGNILIQSACGNYLSIQTTDYEFIGDEVFVEFEYLVDSDEE
jgi:hypothetical protein